MKLLLYCSKAKPYLTKVWKNQYDLATLKEVVEQDTLNGKIVAECDYEVEEICSEKIDNGVGYEPIFYTETVDDISKGSCLTQFEIEDYLGCKVGGEVVGYAIYIKNLHIFDKPKELNSIRYKNHSVKSASQNMMKVYDYNGEYYILISVSSQEMCRIANKEQTILVRKKVLKEMLK